MNISKLSVSSSPRISVAGRSPMPMDGMLEKIQDRKKRERLENRIHYSSYWGNYSRVLSLPEENERGHFIELDLTPINGLGGDSEYIRNIWTHQTGAGRIRSHFTARDARDKEMKELPPKVILQMQKFLSQDKIEWLLTFDFMSHINLELLYNPSLSGSIILFSQIKK